MTDDNLVIATGGLHIWGLRGDSLGAITTEAIKKRAKKHTHRELEHPSMRSVSSRLIEVRTDLPQEAASMLAALGEEILAMLGRELGALSTKNPVLVRVFANPLDFRQLASRYGASIAESMYHPKYKETSFHFSPEIPAQRVERIYAHELTHAYMDLAYDVTAPLWFAEGMAENFSDLEWTDRGFVPTGKNKEALITFQMKLGVDLGVLLAAGRDDIYTYNFQRWYSSAWAFTRFLLDRHPEVVEQLLHKEDVPLIGLEGEYQAYLADLLKA